MSMFNHHGAKKVGLSEKKCQPCRGGVPPLTAEEIEPLFEELVDWELKNDNRLLKVYKFNDFKSALSLANKIGEIAEEEEHHPDLLVRWGELKIELWTHRINGLTESDFILAAKIDQLKT
jgi:4a-hydroxytetrahydrobiopterin dehydratase